LQRAAARYVLGLLTDVEPREPKSVAHLARLASQRLDEAVDSQSLHHLLHDARWSASNLQRTVAERAVPKLVDVSLLLIAMRAPRLGERTIHRRDEEFGTTQMVAALHAVGQARRLRDQIEVLPLRMELSFEGPWHELTDEDLAASGVERDELVDHISRTGTDILREVAGWDLPTGLTLVAGPSFSRLRQLWYRNKRPYLVEARAAELDRLDDLLRQGTRRETATETATDVGESSVSATMRRFAGQTAALVRVHDGDGWRRHMWTNLGSVDEAALLAQQRMDIRMAPLYADLRSRLGLDDYAGRSIVGWRRHRALVSLAQGFLIERRDAGGELAG
jgi:hypothetical protein